MKKFILVALAAILAISISYAQAPVLVGTDVLVNTGTVTKTWSVTSGTSGIIVSATLTLNSGTGAGTAQLSVSMDGVNYVNQGSAYTITNTATQVMTAIILTAPIYPYYKLVYTGSGTENVTIKTYYRAPKYQPTP